MKAPPLAIEHYKKYNNKSITDKETTSIILNNSNEI
jgi:hypothetical protein